LYAHMNNKRKVLKDPVDVFIIIHFSSWLGF
jgi:hypothetical protein